MFHRGSTFVSLPPWFWWKVGFLQNIQCPISAKTSHLQNESTQKSVWAVSSLINEISSVLNLTRKKKKRFVNKNTWWLSKVNSQVRKYCQAFSWDHVYVASQASSISTHSVRFWIVASMYPNSLRLLFPCFHFLSFSFLLIVVASLKRSMNRSYSLGAKKPLFSFKL